PLLTFTILPIVLILTLNCAYRIYFISLFFLIIRRSPISTLFPYTTLFRSVRVLAVEGAAGHRGVDAQDGIERRDGPVRPEAKLRDRKSTRLNSSHGSISYAVFCLKKKKQIINKKTARKEER